MKTSLFVTIIGAGGVASYLLPVLAKTFNLSGELWDADILEERNLDRQLFDKSDVGKNKAEALLNLVFGKVSPVSPVPSYFSSDSGISPATQLLICVADNHLARCAALERADASNIPVILGGNEYFDSEAYIYFPDWRYTKADPRIRHPELLTDKSGSPFTSCTGKAQEASPQLAIANQRCATQILHLLWILPKLARNPINLPIELTTSIYGNTALTLDECQIS